MMRVRGLRACKHGHRARTGEFRRQTTVLSRYAWYSAVLCGTLGTLPYSAVLCGTLGVLCGTLGALGWDPTEQRVCCRPSGQTHRRHWRAKGADRGGGGGGDAKRPGESRAAPSLRARPPDRCAARTALPTAPREGHAERRESRADAPASRGFSRRGCALSQRRARCAADAERGHAAGDMHHPSLPSVLQAD